MATLYVNQPGGVISKMKDGDTKSFKYGDRIDPNEFPDHVDPSTFADSKQRVAVESSELEAHRRAAEAENGQVNSSSSPVPGNYSELDEDGAARLMSNLAAYPELQAKILVHEVLYAGNRQKVVDAAGEGAQAIAGVQIADIPESERTLPKTDPDDEVATSPGDPLRGGVSADPDEIAEQMQQRAKEAMKSVGRKGKSKLPPPSSSSSDSGQSGSDAEGWDAFDHSQLKAYIDQHGLDVPKNLSRDEMAAQIAQHEGHDQPQTPPEG